MALGLLLAWAGVRAIIPWLPSGLPRVASIATDLRVPAAAVTAALATGIGFGLVPAIQSSRPNLSAALKGSGRTAAASAGSHRLRSAPVVAEVALAVVLVVCAGLFIGSFAKLMHVDPGFDYRRVLTVNVGVRWQPDKLEEAFQQSQAYTRLMLEAVSRVPGVEVSAAVSGALPLSGTWNNTSVTLPGRGKLTGDGMSIERRTATPGGAISDGAASALPPRRRPGRAWSASPSPGGRRA